MQSGHTRAIDPLAAPARDGGTGVPAAARRGLSPVVAGRAVEDPSVEARRGPSSVVAGGAVKGTPAGARRRPSTAVAGRAVEDTSVEARGAPPGSAGALPPASGRAMALAAEPWERAPLAAAADTDRVVEPLPHVVAWNLTRRCNLSCAHCYIAAGSWHSAAHELPTDTCRRIIDELLEVNPGPMLILSGGEPLVRPDLEQIAAHAAAGGATVVVGTNGTALTAERIGSLQDAGVQGVAISIDSLDERYHNRFRHGGGALEQTLAAVERLRAAHLDFVVQTTLTRGNRDELDSLVAWAAEKGAVSFNLYFLVPTGRGDGMRGLSPVENEQVLRDLVRLQRQYRGTLMIRSKCQPQIMRHVFEQDPQSPLLHYGTRCPCGVQYCRITPEGKVTPCPYLPVVAGDLTQATFAEVWTTSAVFQTLRGAARDGVGSEPEDGLRDGVRDAMGDESRHRAADGPRAGVRTGNARRGWSVAAAAPRSGLGGKCGRCEYRRLCGGCRARSFAETGDLLGADESCAYEPTGETPVIEPARSVTYGMAAPAVLVWSDDARARLARIPSFVRGVVTSRIEAFAREHGYAEVTLDVMREVRQRLPVDFSKRKPFFLRDDE